MSDLKTPTFYSGSYAAKEFVRLLKYCIQVVLYGCSNIVFKSSSQLMYHWCTNVDYIVILKCCRRNVCPGQQEFTKTERHVCIWCICCVFSNLAPSSHNPPKMESPGYMTNKSVRLWWIYKLLAIAEGIKNQNGVALFYNIAKVGFTPQLLGSENVGILLRWIS